MTAFTEHEQQCLERIQIAQHYSNREVPWGKGEVVPVEPAGKFLKRAAVALGVLLLIAAMATYRPALQALDQVGYSEARL